jgi:ferritin-like metal-binding protein YciE
VIGLTPALAEKTMTTASNLKDVYADEIKDLWSANDQMSKVVGIMAGKAQDPELKRALENSIVGISKHADTIKNLLEDAGETVKKEHCRGMEGLVIEATRHFTDEAPETPELLDIVIVAQYQRMSHYGLAGFGTAQAYAEALGMTEHANQLEAIVNDIYKGDEYASKLAEKAERSAISTQ